MSKGLPGTVHKCRLFSAIYSLSLSLSLTHTGWTEAERKHLGQELSDVLIYLVRLAEQCEVDLPAAILDKFKLNAIKYPPTPEQSTLKYSRQENQRAED